MSALWYRVIVELKEQGRFRFLLHCYVSRHLGWIEWGETIISLGNVVGEGWGIQGILVRYK